ncbi:hypothetical protein HON86_02055 [Candidatus Woesearchaeota archaeon]|jgi:hypothetical protein|nr:hypothetical protein [Candidatus Woesearchaeota archaeon]MBT4835382.1 hypothetical protein [Candidatus Woesearchaeota archaeon]MBT6735022.1 hypothetical protein [Candidatus Woesearchaeota archaeon]MBT7169881.1 hypothetical protein [Candidatus Woesearchaeota archaeon]MBT7474883.1 hypothetical protein [Candidatus Woesearchaeota archaeon]
MKKIIYDGSYGGLHTYSNFVNLVSDLEGFEFAGKYEIPSKVKNGGLVGVGWTFGEMREKTRLVYLARYTNRTSKLMSFLKGEKNFNNVKIEIEARKRERLDNIENIINDALRSE